MESGMSKRMKAGFWCYLLAMLLIGIHGLIYLTRVQFMPYHAAAIGETWAEVGPEYQILLISLIRSDGGAFLATAVAIGIILFIPFKQGIRWANWAILAIGLVANLTGLFTTLSVTLNTPVTAPWHGPIMVIILLVVGFVLSLESEKKTQQIK